MRWIFWVLIVLVVVFINNFIPWVRRKTMGKDNRTLLEISEWQEKHLVRRTQQKKRIWCYQSDTGNVFRLGDREAKIKAVTDKAEKLVKIFEERRQSRRSLAKDLRTDPLLDQIEDSFAAAMTQYLTELNMFQYDRIADRDYTDGVLSHIGDYLLALTQSAATDIDSEREMIANAVQGMTHAVAEAREDISLPAPAPQDGGNQQMPMQ